VWLVARHHGGEVPRSIHVGDPPGLPFERNRRHAAQLEVSLSALAVPVGAAELGRVGRGESGDGALRRGRRVDEGTALKPSHAQRTSHTHTTGTTHNCAVVHVEYDYGEDVGLQSSNKQIVNGHAKANGTVKFIATADDGEDCAPLMQMARTIVRRAAEIFLQIHTACMRL
jgi:hypothetical protein